MSMQLACQACGHDLTEHRHCICYSQQSNGDFCWCHEDKHNTHTPETETP